MNQSTRKNYNPFKKIKQLWLKLCAIGLLLGTNYMVYAVDPTQDLLAPVKAEATANFGANSTFMFLVYFIEIILGSVAYVKTKNFWSLIGVVVVLIFTTVAFKMIA